MTGTKGTPPANKIFSDAMIARMRAFVAANYPTSTAAVAEMLFEEFGEFQPDRRVARALLSRRINVGHNPSAVRSNAAVMARIREMVAADPKAAGNAALVSMIKTEFGLDVTEGQVAGAIRAYGLSRGGPRPGQRTPRDPSHRPQKARPPETPSTPPAVAQPRPQTWPNEAREQARRREEMLRHALRGG